MAVVQLIAGPYDGGLIRCGRRCRREFIPYSARLIASLDDDEELELLPAEENRLAVYDRLSRRRMVFVGWVVAEEET